jgi:hypothetical protein
MWADCLSIGNGRLTAWSSKFNGTISRLGLSKWISSYGVPDNYSNTYFGVIGDFRGAQLTYYNRTDRGENKF